MAAQPATEFDAGWMDTAAVTAKGSGTGAIYAQVSGTDRGGDGIGAVWVEVDSGGVGVVGIAKGQDREGPGTGGLMLCDLGPGLMAMSQKADAIWCASYGPQNAGIVGMNLSGSNNGTGVYGSADGTGVLGNSWSSNHAGVYGENPNGVGVAGKASASNSAGVLGTCDLGAGVIGRSKSSKGAGVYGECSSGAGVAGKSVAASGQPGGIGVYGLTSGSNSGTGIYGEAQGHSVSDGSTRFTGVRGVGADFGVEGIGATGVYGRPLPGGLYAAAFEGGQVLVKGDLVVTGMKSAAVAHPDGSHRLLYSLECPESWFEDFGTGKIVRGRARVKLERNFAAVVRTRDYHVFVTPEADSRGLYVSSKTSKGFEVREQQGGRSSLTFSYRIVAIRKDILGDRLKKTALLPPIPRPTPLAIAPSGPLVESPVMSSRAISKVLDRKKRRILRSLSGGSAKKEGASRSTLQSRRRNQN
jgi:hypothetical protein